MIFPETREAWRVYEKDNERANKQYERDTRTIDHRYDPHGAAWQEERYGPKA